MRIKKKKKIAAIIAGTLAVSIALSGTYAWQSISQSAKNQAVGYANYGGRLHDDFNGTNKDVYVENFTVEDENGAPIFVRVRLDEYMETGMEAGVNPEGTTRKATPLAAGSTLKDKNTWKTHIPGNTSDPFHEIWDWTMGGEKVYMPTFNKNQDSLAVDVNGTYEGPDGKTDAPNPDRYLDYVTYEDGQQKTASAVYDMDDNDTDEGDSAVEGAHVKKDQETHTARMTQKAEVITMEQWKTDKNYTPGRYWVYDTDGWAYWGEALQPGEATGLLIDGISMKEVPEEHWYYAINVVGQFASVRDWGSATEKDGFFDPTGNSKAPSADAMYMLNIVADSQADAVVSATGNPTHVDPGGTQQFSAVRYLGDALDLLDQDVDWAVSGNTSTKTTINDDGLLTVDLYEKQGGTLTIMALEPAASTMALDSEVSTMALEPGAPQTWVGNQRVLDAYTLTVNTFTLTLDGPDNTIRNSSSTFTPTLKCGDRVVTDGTFSYSVSGNNHSGTRVTLSGQAGSLYVDYSETSGIYVTVTVRCTNYPVPSASDRTLTTNYGYYSVSKSSYSTLYRGQSVSITSVSYVYNYRTSRTYTPTRLEWSDSSTSSYYKTSSNTYLSGNTVYIGSNETGGRGSGTGTYATRYFNIKVYYTTSSYTNTSVYYYRYRTQ